MSSGDTTRGSPGGTGLDEARDRADLMGGGCPGEGDCEPGASPSLEVTVGVPVLHRRKTKGPWPWERFGSRREHPREEDGCSRSGNWEQEADLCYFLPWALGVWESEQPPPWEAEGGRGRGLVFMGTRSLGYSGWRRDWGK